ncbi:MAG: autotransporter outer membrane beta-barrel domain-containing protein [Endomicrobia bacterium]|nr:autotransporter outer membrane beta-barrel domain-containing protein [Endomicrobiia bacterium]
MQSKNQNFVSSGLPDVSAYCTSGDDYFSSSEYVSSSFSSAVRAPFVNQIVAGGKKIVLTAALAGMLNTNLVQPAQAQFTSYVSSGVTVTGQTVSGGTQHVLSTGRASSGILISGGTQILSNNGYTVDTSIYNGGTQNVSSGYASRTSIFSGGTQIVSSGGATVSSFIYNGGTVNILNSGSAWIGTMYGGTQNISSGGLASSIHISDGVQNVSSGGTAVSTVLSGGTQNVLNGGSASNIHISGGVQNVFSGGNIYSIFFYSGGTQNVFANSVIFMNILNGATQNVSSGGVVFRTAVSGGTQNVFNGGKADSSYINAGGTQNISTGGIASDTTVGSGGTISGFGGIVAGSTTINNAGLIAGAIVSGGSLFINSGGSARNVTISSGGSMQVSAGANVSSATVSAGGIQNILTNAAAASTAISGNAFVAGVQNIAAGGTALNARIYEGGVQNIAAGATAVSAFISGSSNSMALGNYGVQNILSGGTALNTEISVNGIQNISSGAVASNTTVNSGGAVSGFGGIVTGSTTVNSRGLIISAIVSGGSLLMNIGGSARNVTISNGGSMQVSAGANVSSTTIAAGGIQNILTGGDANSTFLIGGTQNVSGGTAVSTLISSGMQNIFNNGWAWYTSIYSGGTQNVSAGGIAVAAHISNGGTQNISGSAYTTYISSGGKQNVLSGGTAYSAFINDGGTQNVSGGGLADSIFINGGTQNVLNGGLANSISIESGMQNISNGGSALNTSIYGGIQNVLAGAIANSTFVNGGEMNISSGANASDAAVSGSGTINIIDGAFVSGIVDVNAGGILNGKISAALNNLNISGGSWINTKDSEVKNLVFDGGRIDMRSGSAPGNVLTIQNLSASNNPVIAMNAELGDETSPADLVKVTGTHTGNTLLQVYNTGGKGYGTAGSGIQVVDASGAAGDGTFALLGGKVDAGAYNYILEQMPDLNYYLVTYKELSDFSKTMLNAPLINVFAARSAMTNMESRLGDLRAFGYEQNKQGLWMRAYGKSATVKDLAETDITLFALEAGYDRLFNIFGNKLYAGITAGYMSVNDIKTKINEGSKGTGSIPSFGLYASLIGQNDFFADLTVKEIMSNLEMTNYDAGGTELNFEPKRNILALTLEGGKLFKKELQGSYLRVEPKAGILFMNAGSGSAKVENGIGNLEYDGTNYLTAKAGIILGFVKMADGKAIIEPLIELAYLQELLGKGKIRYDGLEHESDTSGGSVEIGAGLNAKLSDKIRLYGQISYESGEKIKAAGVNVGAQYSF